MKPVEDLSLLKTHEYAFTLENCVLRKESDRKSKETIVLTCATDTDDAMDEWLDAIELCTESDLRNMSTDDESVTRGGRSSITKKRNQEYVDVDPTPQHVQMDYENHMPPSPPLPATSESETEETALNKVAFDSEADTETDDVEDMGLLGYRNPVTPHSSLVDLTVSKGDESKGDNCNSSYMSQHETVTDGSIIDPNSSFSMLTPYPTQQHNVSEIEQDPELESEPDPINFDGKHSTLNNDLEEFSQTNHYKLRPTMPKGSSSGVGDAGNNAPVVPLGRISSLRIKKKDGTQPKKKVTMAPDVVSDCVTIPSTFSHLDTGANANTEEVSASNSAVLDTNRDREVTSSMNSVLDFSRVQISVVNIVYPSHLYNRVVLLDFLSNFYEQHVVESEKNQLARELVHQITTMGAVVNNPFLIRYAQLIREQIIESDDGPDEDTPLTGHELMLHQYDKYVSLLRTLELVATEDNNNQSYSNATLDEFCIQLNVLFMNPNTGLKEIVPIAYQPLSDDEMSSHLLEMITDVLLDSMGADDTGSNRNINRSTIRNTVMQLLLTPQPESQLNVKHKKSNGGSSAFDLYNRILHIDQTTNVGTCNNENIFLNKILIIISNYIRLCDMVCRSTENTNVELQQHFEDILSEYDALQKEKQDMEADFNERFDEMNKEISELKVGLEAKEHHCKEMEELLEANRSPTKMVIHVQKLKLQITELEATVHEQGIMLDEAATVLAEYEENAQIQNQAIIKERESFQLQQQQHKESLGPLRQRLLEKDQNLERRENEVLLREKQLLEQQQQFEMKMFSQPTTTPSFSLFDKSGEFDNVDSNKDGIISREELSNWLEEKQRLIANNNQEMSRLVMDNNMLRKCLDPSTERAYHNLHRVQLQLEQTKAELNQATNEIKMLKSEVQMGKQNLKDQQAKLCQLDEEWIAKFQAYGLDRVLHGHRSVGTCTSQDGVMVSKKVGVGTGGDTKSVRPGSAETSLKAYLHSSHGSESGSDTDMGVGVGVNLKTLRKMNGVGDVSVNNLAYYGINSSSNSGGALVESDSESERGGHHGVFSTATLSKKQNALHSSYGDGVNKTTYRDAISIATPTAIALSQLHSEASSQSNSDHMNQFNSNPHAPGTHLDGGRPADVSLDGSDAIQSATNWLERYETALSGTHTHPHPHDSSGEGVGYASRTNMYDAYGYPIHGDENSHVNTNTHTYHGNRKSSPNRQRGLSHTAGNSPYSPSPNGMQSRPHQHPLHQALKSPIHLKKNPIGFKPHDMASFSSSTSGCNSKSGIIPSFCAPDGHDGHAHHNAHGAGPSHTFSKPTTASRKKFENVKKTDILHIPFGLKFK